MDEPERVIRIISGSPQAVEDEVNGLLHRYAPLSWHFASDHAGIRVTVLLVSERELHKQRFAAMQLQAAAKPPTFR
jgi:hypothetical protein